MMLFSKQGSSHFKVRRSQLVWNNSLINKTNPKPNLRRLLSLQIVMLLNRYKNSKTRITF